MTRLLFRALNAPGLILLMVVSLGLATSFFAPYPLSYFQLDVILLGVLWCALHRDFTEGGFLVLILGDIAEIHTAAPGGIFLLSYMLVFLSVRASSRYLDFSNRRSLLGLTFVATSVQKCTSLLILYLLGVPSLGIQSVFFAVFPGALVEMAVILWAFKWLEKFDGVTFKNPRAAQGLEHPVELQDRAF
ncbi:hypothetical protein WDW86_07450 [Bdellovibrionota bacterium FG-2]